MTMPPDDPDVPETAADAGLADAGLADAGLADDGVADEGLADAGLADAGLADAGLADDGVADEGLADAGLADDAPASDLERARARAFADLIDKVVAGRPPAAVSAEDQELLEVATVIRAATRPVPLPARRTEALIEGALAAAIERRAGRPSPDVSAGDAAVVRPGVTLVDQLAPRRRAARAPWIIATATSLVAAAALLLWARDHRRGRTDVASPTATAALPDDQRSRPADALIGVIAPAQAGAAVDRIDAIYADRLGGYRDRTMAGGSR